MTFGELFAGIGGAGLGFERAGMTCKWQVENHCGRIPILERRFPEVMRYGDVTTFLKDATDDEIERWRVNGIVGGFPCQDISFCGAGAGIDGERSGLYREAIRIIRLLRPDWAVLENVPALTVRGLERVLRDVAESGLDAEWDCLPASAFGAPHERDRIFILAYAPGFNGGDLLEACREWGPSLQSRRLSGLAMATAGERENTRLLREPRLDRLVQRVPGALDRLDGCGNSIFPAVAEWIGRRLMGERQGPSQEEEDQWLND